MTIDKLGFGKHRDKTYEEVAKTHPQYLKWIINTFAHYDPRVEAAKKALSYDIISAPPAIDIHGIVPEHFGNGKEMMGFQKTGLAFTESAGGNVMIADEMGCISGDAMISINRAGKSFKIRLDQLHMKFNHLGGNWKPESEIQTMARSLMPNKTFRLNKVLDVVYKGEHDTLLIKTQSGKELKLTPDHKVRTPTGWVEALTLEVGSKIFINGKHVCKLCGSEEDVITYKYAKFKGFCKKCMYRQLRDNSLTYARTVREHGKGTYISGGLKYHPHNTTGGIPEHRLIMEAKENGLSLDEWLERLRTNDLDGCMFLDPNIDVHHINGDPHDNRVANLHVVTKSNHHKIHDRYKNISDVFIPKEDTIISIETAGIQRVFDIVMDDPAHNFIANGIVVHNCGKTIEALSYLALHPDWRPAVVVCPASLKLNWQREVEMWLETGETTEVIKNGKLHPLTVDRGIIILNYDILKKWLPELKAIKPQVLIYDESHSLKNKAAARSKAAAQLAKTVPHKILLTGTPVLNRPSELWNQLCIIDPKQYNSKSFFSWHKRYTAAHQLHFGQKTVWDFSGASNLKELAESLKGTMIRRTKAEVLPELPAKRRQTLLVSIDNRREYNHAEKDFLSWTAEQKGHAAAERASSVEQLSMVEALRQIAIQGKMKQAIEWICDFLETGEKLVVFATHRATIDTLMAEFSKVAVRLDGGMCAEEKQLSVDRFQTDPEIRLFVGNIQAAGVGITLTAASNVLFVELGWTPTLHEQAEDRTCRIGQKNAVNCYYVIAENTIDEKIANILEAKGGITSAAIGDNRDIAFKIFNTCEK